ncbi:putative methyltransferase-domain-containing protein [Parasitella parasitica]|nr:putative methyltransferase-domain-containing protein [Parasitella parasitica]
MMEQSAPVPEFGDFDYIAEREQEVKAHVGSISFEGLAEPILLAQDLSGGCGGKIWECANIMVDYFIWKNNQLNGKLFKNQKIVELGSGTGLVGLAVAKLCPEIKQMVITDQLPMIGLMKENIKLNHLEHSATAEILNWGEAISNHSQVLDADVILASDCIYLEIAFIPLLETFFALTNKPSSVIYLAYKKRRNADKLFFQAARKKFVFTEVTEDPKMKVYARDKSHLFCVTRKPLNQHQLQDLQKVKSKIKMAEA